MNSRYRPLIYAVAGVALVWVLALAGFAIARNSKMTAEKLQAFLQRTDLSKLSAEERRKFLQELADKMNKLSQEERRKARAGHLWNDLFAQLTEEEKAEFIEATMPTGFKQMLTAFEELPAEKRQRAIDDAMKRMKESREKMDSGELKPKARGTNQPVLSEDLQKKVAEIGLKTYYSQSSAQTKAELAPLMEEIQRGMESGRMFRGR